MLLGLFFNQTYRKCSSMVSSTIVGIGVWSTCETSGGRGVVKNCWGSEFENLSESLGNVMHPTTLKNAITRIITNPKFRLICVIILPMVKSICKDIFR
jgi:hypothetical protein